MTATLIAFHGQPEIKDKYLSRVRAHRAADQIIKGQYWNGGKGCAVGCTIHGSQHSKYETELGIPRLLAKLEDGIFEGLANEHAMEWPERFLSAIEPGADLSNVWPQFAVWLLGDETHGVIRFAKTDRTKKDITDVVNAFKKQLEGVKIEAAEWRSIRAAAYRTKREEMRKIQADKLIELLQAAPKAQMATA